MKVYIVMRADVEGWPAGSDAHIGRVLGVYETEAPARIVRNAEHDFDTPAWIEVWDGGQMVESIPPLVAK